MHFYLHIFQRQDSIHIMIIATILISYFFQAECFAALESIAQKVNERDADMRSHIVLSMFKV